uniref:Uncharacterized protein n=1 Tax=Anguilla anguilla TaxID=7936 RepID=A0A0E9PD88_ANGAN
MFLFKLLTLISNILYI